MAIALLVIMVGIVIFGRFYLDVLNVEPIEQVSCQLSPSSRIVRTEPAILGKHPPGPELWTENDNTDNDHQQGYQHHIPLPSPLSDVALGQGHCYTQC